MNMLKRIVVRLCCLLSCVWTDAYFLHPRPRFSGVCLGTRQPDKTLLTDLFPYSQWRMVNSLTDHHKNFDLVSLVDSIQDLTPDGLCGLTHNTLQEMLKHVRYIVCIDHYPDMIPKKIEFVMNQCLVAENDTETFFHVAQTMTEPKNFYSIYDPSSSSSPISRRQSGDTIRPSFQIVILKRTNKT